jgi:hypothetical protein
MTFQRARAQLNRLGLPTQSSPHPMEPRHYKQVARSLLVASAAISRAETGKYGHYKVKWRQFRINTRLWITLKSPRYDNFFPFFFLLIFSSRCAVGIATGYGLDNREVGVQVPVVVKNFHFSTSSRPTLEPTQPPIQRVPQVKQPGREADH